MDLKIDANKFEVANGFFLKIERAFSDILTKSVAEAEESFNGMDFSLYSKGELEQIAKSHGILLDTCDARSAQIREEQKKQYYKLITNVSKTHEAILCPSIKEKDDFKEIKAELFDAVFALEALAEGKTGFDTKTFKNALKAKKTEEQAEALFILLKKTSKRSPCKGLSKLVATLKKIMSSPKNSAQDCNFLGIVTKRSFDLGWDVTHKLTFELELWRFERVGRAVNPDGSGFFRSFDPKVQVEFIWELVQVAALLIVLSELAEQNLLEVYRKLYPKAWSYPAS